jgi:chorismate mutase
MSQSPDMAALRGQIDGIDRQLAALMARRSGLAAAVAAAKKAEGDHGFGWRPAREVEILRMVQAAEPGLDPVLAAAVWRAMVASNLAAQGGLSVVALRAAEGAARVTFGVAGDVPLVESAAEAFGFLAGRANAIAVLPADPAAGCMSAPWRLRWQRAGRSMAGAWQRSNRSRLALMSRWWQVRPNGSRSLAGRCSMQQTAWNCAHSPAGWRQPICRQACAGSGLMPGPERRLPVLPARCLRHAPGRNGRLRRSP